VKLIGIALMLATVAAHAATAQRALPDSRLALRAPDSTDVFWRADAAPVRWASAPLAERLAWKPAAAGVQIGEVLLQGSREAWRTRVVIARLDPASLTFSLDTATRGGRPAWNIARTPSDAVFAVNAGQFRSTLPWGLVVLDGRSMLPAERGPLAVTIAVDSAGTLHWIHDGDALPRGVRWAFQSFPSILRANEVPHALRAAGRGIDVGHRDARLALGRLADGSLIVALTRFDGLGGMLKSVPFGLTTPEMAAVMGALGATDAVLLDGGISAQMIAGLGATRIAHEGWRDVPLALVARAIAPAQSGARAAPRSEPRRIK
jgi:hypothetical protein